MLNKNRTPAVKPGLHIIAACLILYTKTVYAGAHFWIHALQVQILDPEYAVRREAFISFRAFANSLGHPR